MAVASHPEVESHEQRQLGEEMRGMSVQTKCGKKAETAGAYERGTER